MRPTLIIASTEVKTFATKLLAAVKDTAGFGFFKDSIRGLLAAAALSSALFAACSALTNAEEAAWAAEGPGLNPASGRVQNGSFVLSFT